MQERPRTCFRLRCFRQSWLAVALSLFALATPGKLSAQSWSGGATLGIQIRGTRGPVEGAVVEIRHRRPGLNAGPEARRTDSRGQANFVGIIDGRWSLEVTHPEYLSFVASINVQRGKKPEIVNQFLEATGPGRGTFRVKYLRTDQPFGEVIPGTAVTERSPQPPPARPSTAQADAPERPVSMAAPEADKPAVEKAEDRSRMDSRAVPSTIVTPAPQPETPEIEAKTPTLTAEVPTPLESPAEQPAPAPVEVPATSTTELMVEPEVEAEAPTPEKPPALAESQEPADKPAKPQAVPVPAEIPVEVPTTEPVAQPPLPDETPSAEPATPIPPESKPTTPPEKAPVPTPTQPEAPKPDETAAPTPLPVPARVPNSLRAYRDRTCFECKPGEWAVSAQLEVATGKACRSTAEVAVRRAMSDVAAAASDQLASFAGPLPLDLTVLPLAAATTAARNTLAPHLDPSASCRFLAIVIPQGGRFMGFRFEALDAEASGDCTGEQECEIGQARFLFSPEIARGTGASFVYSLFENTGGSARTARLTGFFLPADGWSPE